MAVFFLVGAIAGFYLLTRLLYWITRAWPMTAGKAVTVNGIVLVLALALSAIGTGHGGQLDFSNAWAYVVAAAVVLTIDLTRLRRDTLRPAA